VKSPFFAVVLAGLAVATLASAWWSNGDVFWTLLPGFLLSAGYATWKLPLRYPVLVLTFLALTLENPSDVPAVGLWKSAFYTPGALLLSHLNLTLGPRWLFFSGLDLCLLLLFATITHRWLGRGRLDREAPAPFARPMVAFCALSLGGACFMWALGLARGDADLASSLWQMQRVVYLPLVFFVFHATLRGRADRAALGVVFLSAASVKALLAVYLRLTLDPPAGEATLPYATSHADSMLFAGALCLVVALWFERRGRLVLLLVPLLAAGMVANHRRIVWVEAAGALFVLAVITPRTPAKRALLRGAAMVSPVALLYLAIGWVSPTGPFEPVGVIRSIIDSKADPSTMWRDWENYDIFYTFRQSPVFGSGYGHPYIEIVKLPDISQSYALYRFIPHNGALGLWAYGGLVGFAALWTMLAVGLFFGVRSYRFATRPEDRVAALAATSAIVVYLVHCYGDMGLGTWTSVFTVAPAFAVASQLAVSTGAWPSPSPARNAPSAALTSLSEGEPS
jgi:hypothetical protein